MHRQLEGPTGYGGFPGPQRSHAEIIHRARVAHADVMFQRLGTIGELAGDELGVDGRQLLQQWIQLLGLDFGPGGIDRLDLGCCQRWRRNRVGRMGLKLQIEPCGLCVEGFEERAEAGMQVVEIVGLGQLQQDADLGAGIEAGG